MLQMGAKQWQTRETETCNSLAGMTSISSKSTGEEPAVATEPPMRLPAFQLHDQFGRATERAAFDCCPLIVMVGSREGAAGVAQWTAALRAQLGEGSATAVLPVADLVGVPRMIRGLVLRLLPRDPAHWCAIDWDGQLGARIRGEHGSLVAAAYDSEGMLMTWAALPPDNIDRELLLTLVDWAARTG